jgi:thymidylate kinase
MASHSDQYTSSTEWVNTLLNVLSLVIITYLLIDKTKLRRAPSPTSENAKRFKRIDRFASEETVKTNIKINMSSARMRNITKICVTGGPCAGKTTSLARIAERIPELGYKVFTVPEAATLLMKSGAMINVDNLDNSGRISLQATLIKLQASLEDIFTRFAEATSQKALVVCDRGVMDGSAYISSDLWQALLDEIGSPVVHLRDNRYDAVIHLVTAAQGAEDHFQTLNNEARYEGLQQARAVDRLLQKAWTGHPNFFIIENEGIKSFDAKVQRCYEQVCKVLGEPMTTTYSYKFLIHTDPATIPKLPEHIHSQKISVDETFLSSSSDKIERITRRGESNSFTYIHTLESIQPDGPVQKIAHIITVREYLQLMEKKDTTRQTVNRCIQCFVWGDDYYILDSFLNVKRGISFLRIDTSKEPDNIKPPPMFKIIRDVKDNPGYSTHKLAKIDYYIYEQDKEVIPE